MKATLTLLKWLTAWVTRLPPRASTISAGLGSAVATGAGGGAGASAGAGAGAGGAGAGVGAIAPGSLS